MTNSQKWFEEEIVEDKETLLEIGNVANKTLYDKLAMTLPSAQLALLIYAKTMESVVEAVKGKRDEYSDYELKIADRLSVGYTNFDNEDAEKNGNFGVTIKHIEGTLSDDRDDEDEENTITLATEWNAKHITSDIEIIKEIAEETYKTLSTKYDVSVGSTETIIPAFIIIHETMISYLKLKRAEENTDEYEINMCGMFFAGCKINDNGDEEIYFTVPVETRLNLKDDLSAGNKTEQ